MATAYFFSKDGQNKTPAGITDATYTGYSIDIDNNGRIIMGSASSYILTGTLDANTLVFDRQITVTGTGVVNARGVAFQRDWNNIQNSMGKATNQAYVVFRASA